MLIEPGIAFTLLGRPAVYTVAGAGEGDAAGRR